MTAVWSVLFNLSRFIQRIFVIVFTTNIWHVLSVSRFQVRIAHWNFCTGLRYLCRGLDAMPECLVVWFLPAGPGFVFLTSIFKSIMYTLNFFLILIIDTEYISQTLTSVYMYLIHYKGISSIISTSLWPSSQQRPQKLGQHSNRLMDFQGCMHGSTWDSF